MYRKFLFSFTILCVSVIAVTASVETEKSRVRAERAARKFNIKVAPWGPTQADVDAARARVEMSDVVRRELNGSKYREVGFEYVNDGNEAKGKASQPPTRFRMTYYSYSSDLALVVEGDFAGKEMITARWENVVPSVSEAEWAAAFRVVEQDPSLKKTANGNNGIYRAMPPTTVIDGERLINVGVADPATGDNQIVGVSFKNNKVVKYPNNAPPTAAATPDACGITNAGQPPTGQGLAGQATLTVNDNGGNPLWEMLVVRPSSSSGRSFERSGLEIRDVKYKGKMVLKRGHVPILNVKYVSGCGPFRDWQYSEEFFNAPDAGAQNPAAGIRILAPGQIATTVVETGNDFGNFQGVAIYTQDVGFGPEVVLVTEMNASWYRYIMEWRFGADGTIRPRFGFGSVGPNSCICIQRTHHVYWRLDFDVVNANNRVYLMDRGRRYQQLIETESAFFKRAGTNRMFMIQNATGDEAYQLVPGSNDGTVTDPNGNLADPFGAGDFWLMRFKGTSATPDELDDDDGFVYPAANIAPWVNGESMANQDIVVWYAAHQVRQDDSSRTAAPNVIAGAHVVGPTLRPVRW